MGPQGFLLSLVPLIEQTKSLTFLEFEFPVSRLCRAWFANGCWCPRIALLMVCKRWGTSRRSPVTLGSSRINVDNWCLWFLIRADQLNNGLSVGSNIIRCRSGKWVGSNQNRLDWQGIGLKSDPYLRPLFKTSQVTSAGQSEWTLIIRIQCGSICLTRTNLYY